MNTRSIVDVAIVPIGLSRQPGDDPLGTTPAWNFAGAVCGDFVPTSLHPWHQSAPHAWSLLRKNTNFNYCGKIIMNTIVSSSINNKLDLCHYLILPFKVKPVAISARLRQYLANIP